VKTSKNNKNIINIKLGFGFTIFYGDVTLSRGYYKKLLILYYSSILKYFMGK